MTPTTARALALAEAGRAGVDPNLFMRLIQQESGWNPTATSPVGAYGLTQAMPATWAQPGFGVTPGGDRNDPQEQLRFGADYMSAMLNRYDGDPVRAAVAYNWGPGNADNWSGNMADLPAETRNYVQNVAYGQNSEGGRSLAQQTREQLEAEAAAQAQYTDEAGGVPAADNSIMSSSAISRNPEVTSLMEEEDEGFQATFHPGMALSSIGAALSAVGRGENPTAALTRIRRNYFDRRKQAEDEQRREASSRLLGGMAGVDPELAKALPPDILAAMIRQQRDITGRKDIAQMGIDAEMARLTKRLGQNADQFAITTGIDRDKLLLDQRRLDAQIDKWGVDNEIERERIAQQNTQWGAEFAIKSAEFDRGNQGAAEAKEFIASTYDSLGQRDMAEKVRAMPDNAFQDPNKINQFRQMASDNYLTKDHRTAAMKEWDRYQQMLATAETYDDPEIRRQKRLEANQFWNSVQDKNSHGEWFKESYKADLGLSDNDYDRVSSNNDTIAALNFMEQMVSEFDVNTGPFEALIQPYIAPLTPILAPILGDDWAEDVNAKQVVFALNQYLSTKVKTAGSISNYEQKTFERIVPGLGTPKEQFAAMINFHRGRAMQDNARTQFIRGQLKPDGSGMSYTKAEEQWDEMQYRGDPETHPQVLTWDRFTPENRNAFMEARGVDPNSRAAGDVMVVYNGKVMTAAQAENQERRKKRGG